MAKVESVETFSNTDMKSLKDCDNFVVYGIVEFDDEGLPILCTNVLFESRDMAYSFLKEMNKQSNVLPLRYYYEPIEDEG